MSPRQKHALAIVDRMVPRARRAACKSAVLSWPDAEVWDRIEKLRKQAERMAAPGPGLAFLLTGETTAEAKASSGAAP